MQIERLVLGPLDTNCFVVVDRSDNACVVIDPADSVQRILEVAGGADIVCVVLTHCHFDHLAAVNDLLDRTQAALAVHEDDAAFLADPTGTGAALFGMPGCVARDPDRLLRDGDVVKFGSKALHVLHTPGHTPGSICLLGEGHLFAGDTVFAGSVGRTDFPRGDARRLATSIRDSILPLDDAIVVHPGHGPDTTIGRERAVNPFFPRSI